MCDGAGGGWNWFQTFVFATLNLRFGSISGGLDVYSTGVIMTALSPNLNRVYSHRIRLFIVPQKTQKTDILRDIPAPSAVVRTAIEATHCT
jgi:hypothetical protein